MEGRLIHSRRTMLALVALVFASCICLGMLFVRGLYTDERKYNFLPWNLLLAWIPLFFALGGYALRAKRTRQHWWLVLCAFLWFLFYPNAPYLITDLVHLKTRPPIPRWYDLILMMSFAWTGLFLGFLSLYLMQEIVRSWQGRGASWLFAVSMLGLGAIGIYLGRFWRWNSWDLIVRPWNMAGEAYHRINSMELREVVAFSVTFFAFSLLIYVTLYTLTHLHGHLEPKPDVNPSPRP